MNDEVCVIRGTRGAILKEYEDGSLAVRLLIEPKDKQQFIRQFPDVGLPVFIARETQDSASTALQVTMVETYGEHAQKLRLWSDWMANPAVWKAIGTDEEYLEWCRHQECTHCKRVPEWEMDTLVLNEAAHVRRVANGAGTAIKPPYSAITLCSGCHRDQHQYGEAHIGGGDHVDKLRLVSVQKWMWETLRTHLRVESMRDAKPRDLLVWAQRRGVDHHLPHCYREAA